MKAIMISIRPQWVAKILNREKTIEIRKRFPSDYVGWVYIYVTKGGGKLRKVVDYDYDTMTWLQDGYEIINDKNCKYETLNGKVVARFWCDKVEEIEPFEEYKSPFGMAYKLTKEKIIGCQKAQLTYDEYNHYLKGKNGKAIHITNLEIFDKPKEIYEMKQLKHFGIRNKCEMLVPITRAPQSYMFIEV